MKRMNHLAIWRFGDLAIDTISISRKSASFVAGKSTDHKITRSPNLRAFTLTELMVAVAVLIVVIIATSKIFGTASKVAGMGQATSAVMTEAATIERAMREDIERLTTEGFFAIRCVAVQNDVRRRPPYNDSSAPLLNPNLDKSAIIRADQLVFFTNGIESSNTYRPGSGTNHKGQGTAARIYWGPAFQLRNALPADLSQYPTVQAHDPAHIANVSNQAASESLTSTTTSPKCTPWHWSATNDVQMVRTTFRAIGANGDTQTDIFGTAASSNINGTQPDCRQWLLVRQPVALMDDDNNPPNVNTKTAYLGDITTARSIFLGITPAANFGLSREIRNGRLDAAASQLADVRRWVSSPNLTGNFVARPWNNAAYAPGDQRRTISNGIYYPRAERKSPSANRVDQALTNHVIGSGCSSFTIDWTYDDGVGRVLQTDGVNPVVTPDGSVLRGMAVNPWLEQPWFGLRDDPRGVYPLNAWGPRPVPIWPLNIERYLPGGGVPDIGVNPSNANPVVTYEALFGYNINQPLDSTTGNPWTDTGTNPAATPVVPVGYTPFPSAIRVTMTLHDPELRMEAGRDFQFVIRLPKRVN